MNAESLNFLLIGLTRRAGHLVRSDDRHYLIQWEMIASIDRLSDWVFTGTYTTPRNPCPRF